MKVVLKKEKVEEATEKRTNKQELKQSCEKTEERPKEETIRHEEEKILTLSKVNNIPISKLEEKELPKLINIKRKEIEKNTMTIPKLNSIKSVPIKLVAKSDSTETIHLKKIIIQMKEKERYMQTNIKGNLIESEIIKEHIKPKILPETEITATTQPAPLPDIEAYIEGFFFEETHLRMLDIIKEGKKSTVLFVQCSEEFLPFLRCYLENLMVDYYGACELKEPIFEEDMDDFYSYISEADKDKEKRHSLVIYKNCDDGFFIKKQIKETDLNPVLKSKLAELTKQRDKIVVFHISKNVNKEIYGKVQAIHENTILLKSNSDNSRWITASLLTHGILENPNIISIKSNIHSGIVKIEDKLILEVNKGEQWRKLTMGDEKGEETESDMHRAKKLIAAKYIEEQYNVNPKEIEFEHVLFNGEVKKISDLYWNNAIIEVVEKHTNKNVKKYINDRILDIVRCKPDTQEIWFVLRNLLFYKVIKKLRS